MAQKIMNEYRGGGRIEPDQTPPASGQIGRADLLVDGVGFFADEEQAEVSRAAPHLAELERDGLELCVCH